MNVLAEAIYWHSLGVSVIPIRHRSKVAAVRWSEYTRRLPTPNEIMDWFGQPLFANYGVICGKRHGQPGYLVVLDFDNLGAGLNWMLSMDALPYTVQTARGIHAYFLTDEPAPTVRFAGGDLKACGYVLGAGSIHPSGCEYRVLIDAPIANICSVYEVLPDLPKPEPKPKPSTILSEPSMPKPLDPWEDANNPHANLVETIRARFSILDFLPDAQKTDPSGRWWIARCPLHDDKHPSLWIDAKRQICGCYAGCAGGKPMDIINLTAQLWGMSNTEAIERLRQML
jgi:hypothetical protein